MGEQAISDVQGVREEGDVTMAKYIIEVDDEQADIIRNSLEFYARILIGQWQEIGYHCLDLRDEDYVHKFDCLKKGLGALRPFAFPDLPPNLDSSYGVTNRPVPCRAWEIYTTIRHRLAWTRHPEGGITVDFGRPISYSGKPLPRCESIIGGVRTTKETSNG